MFTPRFNGGRGATEWQDEKELQYCITQSAKSKDTAHVRIMRARGSRETQRLAFITRKWPMTTRLYDVRKQGGGQGNFTEFPLIMT